MIKNLILVQTLEYGGVQRSAVNVANNLDNTKVVLYKNEVDYECNKKIISIGSSPGNNYISKFFKFLYRVWKIRKIKKREKPDNVISFSDGPNLVNILSSAGEKVIISVHSRKTNNKNEDQFLRKIYHKLYSFFYKKSDTLISVSKGVKEDMINNFKIPEEKIKVIYNSIDLNYIDNKANKKIDNKYQSVFDKCKVIINVGRLELPKGQKHLIRFFKKLIREKKVNPKLVILGEGKLKEKLINFSKNLNLNVYSVWGDNDAEVIEDNDIFFLGFKSNPFKFIKNSDIFAFPSLWEGFGLALIEAAACNIALLSSDCKSGPREILSPKSNINLTAKEPEFVKYGVLIPSYGYKNQKNELLKNKQWVKILYKFLEESDLRKKYSKLAKERAKDFDIKKIIKEWKDIL